jgi:hypothetical protein
MSSAANSQLTSSRRFWRALAAGVFLCGCVYVGLGWSPSSYAIVLRELGETDTGLIAGIPRVERGDEFAWQTPLLQMTLRSRFQRIDHTPPYFEDLRTLYAMPILDWALTFKPQFWLFFVASPAIAYSFYHFLLIAMFVVGFTILFVHLGGRDLDSFLMALVLFFSAYTQYWWDGSSNFLFPFFPWIVLALLWNIRFSVRLLLFFWLLVCGLLTYFYPPNAIALGFVALVLWATVRPELLEWRSLLRIGLTAAGAAATVLFYLQEPIARLADTVYPGQRVSAGGAVTFEWWLTQFLPTSQINDHVPLTTTSNICELSTVGSIYALAVVFFAPWRQLFGNSTKEERRRWMWLGGGLAATQMWMTIYMPPWVGYPLLWHLVPPGRMVIAGGLLLLVLAFVLGQARPLRLSVAGCLCFAFALAITWFVFKRPHGIGLREAYRDWIFIVPVVVAAILQAVRILTPARANAWLLASAAALGVISFGTFNPIQSTKAIFRKHSTPLTAELDQQLQTDKRGYLLLPWGTSFFAHSGLPLIALGYPSLTYSTFDPALDLWRKVYPEIPPEQFRQLFDNAGGFALGDVPAPLRVPGTLVTLAPMAPFTRPGATVCDFIRPSRAAFAASVGCPVASAPASTNSQH